MNDDFNPSTGAIFIRPVGDLPKKTVGKRFGLTSFVLTMIPLFWYSLFFVILFLADFAPRQTGLIFLARGIWYSGLVIIPLFCVISAAIGVVAVLRPALSGKIWAIVTFLICALVTLSFFFGYIHLRP